MEYDVCAGQVLCIIVKSKDDVKAFESYQPSDAAAAPAPAAASPAAAPPPAAAAPPPPSAAPAVAAPPAGDGRIIASPLAKKLAAEKGIDLRVCSFIGFLLCDVLVVKLKVCGLIYKKKSSDKLRANAGQSPT